MNLKYRVKKYNHVLVKDYYVAQYRIFYIWMCISILQKGRFSDTNSCRCETIDEAKERIAIHKLNMERAGAWLGKTRTIVHEE